MGILEQFLFGLAKIFSFNKVIFFFIMCYATGREHPQACMIMYESYELLRNISRTHIKT